MWQTPVDSKNKNKKHCRRTLYARPLACLSFAGGGRCHPPPSAVAAAAAAVVVVVIRRRWQLQLQLLSPLSLSSSLVLAAVAVEVAGDNGGWCGSGDAM